MSFAAGSLVKARNREWVVLPESTDDLVMVRPLGGTDHEVTGILTHLEDVQPATFDLPTPDQLGDYRSARLLRDALRLGFRSSAGPFRSPLGLSADPGGLPLYKSGTPVGGVGVISDANYSFDADITDVDNDVDEMIALAATSGLAAPSCTASRASSGRSRLRR